MSKSIKRVRAALSASGADTEVRETTVSRTAADAATALGCAVDQIAKSIILRAETTGLAVLFITAGGRQVDTVIAARLAGSSLGKADAGLIRAQTGFAIGGVAPIGHLTPCAAWFDPRLLEFDVIWAAAGTPHHVFALPPQQLLEISKAQLADFTVLSKKM